jgi:hypothetical protein
MITPISTWAVPICPFPAPMHRRIASSRCRSMTFVVRPVRMMNDAERNAMNVARMKPSWLDCMFRLTPLVILAVVCRSNPSPVRSISVRRVKTTPLGSTPGRTVMSTWLSLPDSSARAPRPPSVAYASGRPASGGGGAIPTTFRVRDRASEGTAKPMLDASKRSLTTSTESPTRMPIDRLRRRTSAASAE